MVPGQQQQARQQYSGSGAKDHRFILDSGSSAHATGDTAILSLELDYSAARVLAAGTDAILHRRDGKTLAVAGEGTVTAGGSNFHLAGVRYVPELGAGLTLVSVQQLAALGFLVMFCGDICYVTDGKNGGTVVGKGRLSGDDGFYHLDFLRIPKFAAAEAVYGAAV